MAGREVLKLDEGAMAGVDERLKEATSYPARVEKEDLFCLFFFPRTFVDYEAGLLFYILI